jgi:VanZ family protein
LRKHAGVFWLFLFAAWFVIILFLALRSGTPSLESTILGWDKLQHAAAFGVLAFLGGKTLEHRLPLVKAWLYAFVLAILLGGLVEIAQAFLTTERTGDWYDFLADILGAALLSGMALFSRCRRKR